MKPLDDYRVIENTKSVSHFRRWVVRLFSLVHIMIIKSWNGKFRDKYFKSLRKYIPAKRWSTLSFFIIAAVKNLAAEFSTADFSIADWKSRALCAVAQKQHCSLVVHASDDNSSVRNWYCFERWFRFLHHFLRFRRWR